MMKRARLVLLVALALLGAGCLAEVDKPAPEMRIVDFEGDVHDLTTMEGEVVVIDLMATWCVPCIAQMEHLNAIRDAYPEEAVTILSVDTDRSESSEQLERWMEQHGARWPYGFDTDGVAQKLGLRILPKVVILSPEGRIVYETQGEAYPASMARVINRYVEPRA